MIPIAGQTDIDSIDIQALYPPKAEFELLKTEFRESILKLVPGLAPDVDDLLRRISSPNWVLEWGLPRWLGETFQLTEDTIYHLTLANVYLLGFVRLMDDIVDDDFGESGTKIEWLSSNEGRKSVSAGQHNQQILLGTLLEHLWLQQNSKLLASSDRINKADRLLSVFWESSLSALSEWIIATSDQERRPVHGFSDFSDEDFLRMGHRFSLLKVGCVTACQLAGREKEIPYLTKAIDQILTGVVLADEVFDWEGDLENGRYNVFIAYCSDIDQRADGKDANELAVLEGIYLGQKAHAFFDLVLDYLSLAEQTAGPVSCVKFNQYIRCMQLDMRVNQANLDEEILGRMKEASKRFVDKGIDAWR
ncbi:MAG: hypothetical protein FWH49_02495 [Clostridiales bacterium]|nr:hypothetical protein [Clostridiales bacterium]